MEWPLLTRSGRSPEGGPARFGVVLARITTAPSLASHRWVLSLPRPSFRQTHGEFLHRFRRKIEARKFPAISFEMKTDCACAFFVAKPDRQFDRLYQRQATKRRQYPGCIDTTESNYLIVAVGAKRSVLQNVREIFGGEQFRN